MEKKKLIITISATVLAIGIVGTGIFFGVRGAIIKKHKNTALDLPEKFTVTAHTGSMGTKDNSLESISAGVKSGANVVEFDVNFTEDGTPVLAHDAPKGDEVTFEQALAVVSQYETVGINIDLKATTNLALVERLVFQYGVEDRAFFTGVKDEYLEAVKKDSPKMKYYLNVDIDKKQAENEEYINSVVQKVKDSGAIGINSNYKNFNWLLVDACREQGLLVSLWTVDKELDMYKVLEMAPDNITTRNPDELIAILKNK